MLVFECSSSQGRNQRVQMELKVSVIVILQLQNNPE